MLLRQHPEIEVLVTRLYRAPHELWLTEYSWKSIEVFASIYDLVCEMMALHGLAFGRHESEWNIVMCEDDGAIFAIQDTPAPG